jgi:hypothetical protein
MKKHVAKLIGDAHKKYNKYNLSGEYGIGYVDDGREFYFDKEDFHLIEKHYWNIDPHGYTYTNNPDRQNGYVHQIILNVPKGFVADHINRNKLDNRKNNLRICKNGDNAKNSNLSKNNKSGIIGISWDLKNNKWTSRITINRKGINLGRFDDFEEAIKARLQAEKFYFGEFVPQQHLYEQYGII